MNKSVILILPILALAISCGRKGNDASAPLEYVTEVLTDSTSLGHAVVQEYQAGNVTDAIAIIGSVKDVAVMSEKFMTCDKFDNIDGRIKSDGLPDFAGETIVPIFDLAHTPYQDFITEGKPEGLREAAVKGAIGAISGNCWSDPFDNEPTTEKKKAKLLVLASSIMSSLGYDDIRDLFGAADKDLNVVAPAQSIVTQLFETNPDFMTIAVWADPSVVSAGVYEKVSGIIADKLVRSGNYSCKSLALEHSGDAMTDLLALLDKYAESGTQHKLNALIIDDLSLSAYADSLNAAVAMLRENDGQRNLKIQYAGLLSDNFKFVSPVSAIAIDCYECLRKSNLFTHKIAYPTIEGYFTVTGRGADDDSETIKIIPANHHYLPFYEDGFDVLAPITYNSLFHVY